MIGKMVKNSSSSSELRLRLISQIFNDRGNDNNNQPEITVLYNGKICVCDVTELQARAIIWMASIKEEGCHSAELRPPLVSLRTPLGLSVKRSLQRFLQDRKKRRQSTAPYPLA